MKASDLNMACSVIGEVCAGLKGKPCILPYTFVNDIRLDPEQALKMIKTNVEYFMALLNDPKPIEKEVI